MIVAIHPAAEVVAALTLMAASCQRSGYGCYRGGRCRCRRRPYCPHRCRNFPDYSLSHRLLASSTMMTTSTKVWMTLPATALLLLAAAAVVEDIDRDERDRDWCGDHPRGSGFFYSCCVSSYQHCYCYHDISTLRQIGAHSLVAADVPDGFWSDCVASEFASACRKTTTTTMTMTAFCSNFHVPCYQKPLRTFVCTVSCRMCWKFCRRDGSGFLGK